MAGIRDRNVGPPTTLANLAASLSSIFPERSAMHKPQEGHSPTAPGFYWIPRISQAVCACEQNRKVCPPCKTEAMQRAQVPPQLLFARVVEQRAAHSSLTAQQPPAPSTPPSSWSVFTRAIAIKLWGRVSISPFSQIRSEAEKDVLHLPGEI